MYEKIPISELTEMEWLKLRKSGLGGSDVGSIVGVNPYSSPMKVFRDKTTDEIAEESSESLRVGHDLEEYVAQRFCEATGKKVRRSNYMYRSKEYPWMIADVDRLVVGEDAILECKTTNAWGASKWEDGIPESYLMQAFHYMALTGKKTVYIACLVMGIGFVYRTLHWDDDIINALIEAEKEFWNEYVVPRKMPPVDGSRSCDEILSKYFPDSVKGTEIRLDGFDDKLERREEILKEIEALRIEQSTIEQEVKLALQDNERGFSARYKVSWSSVESTRLDSKKIKEELPEVFKEYSKTSSSRRFQVRVA